MVMGTLAMHEDYGLLSRQEVMAPAIRFAREGFEVGPTLAGLIADMYEPLSEKEEAAKIYLEDLFPPEVGSVLRNPELAVSLELIAEGGADVMYTGPLAKKIASYLQANGGVLSAEDFASYAMIKSEPLRVKYKNYEVYSAPPPFGGIAVLEALQLYERIDTSKYPGPHSAENIHAMAEVMKLTSADRYDVAGDPRFVKMPTDWLISEEYADLRIKDFNPAKATVPDDVDPGLVWKDRNASGSTTHLTVVDSQGNAVVLTQTLGTFFGSTIVVPGTGILLNDQMKNFSGRSSSPNKLEPRKSMNSTQAPTIVLKDNELVLAVGSPGAYRILTTVFQFLVYALDYDMRLQDANDAPRITARDIYDELRMESRIAEDVRKKLEAMGHVLQVQGEHDLYFGGVHAVARDPKTGMLTGSADLRRDGVAGGFEKEPAASAR
jgi:gamma-glutamyltranspeptidase/glutathione hydrolase